MANPFELGAAHVNVEEMLRDQREVVREELPVFSQEGERVAVLSVSVGGLEALLWVQRSVAATCKIRVSVPSLTLSR